MTCDCIGSTWIIQANLSISKLLVFFKKNLFYFWLCWVFTAVSRLSLVAVSRGYLLVAVPRLLIAVASLIAEH